MIEAKTVVDQLKAGARALGDQVVADEWDTRKHRGRGIAAMRLQEKQFQPQNRGQQVFGFGTQNPREDLGAPWHHRRACIEAKHFHEELVVD